MSRPDPPHASTAPTLFGTAHGSKPEARLRMLAADEPRKAGRPFVLRRPRRSMATAAVLSITAVVAALTLDASTRRPPDRPAAAPSPAPVVRTLQPPAPAAAAVIESIAPAPEVVARVDSVNDRPVTRPPRTAAATSSAAKKPRPTASSALPAAPADADVDLLAAMVTRLQAADAAPDPCRAVEPKRAECPPAHGPTAVSRAAAR